MKNRNSAEVSVDEAKPHDLLLVTQELPIYLQYGPQHCCCCCVEGGRARR